MKECPSCGATVPESAVQCPNCQHIVNEHPDTGGTLMGVPAEGLGGEESDDGGALGESASLSELAAEAEEQGEGDDDEGKGARSTQFGLPVVDRDQPPGAEEASTPMPQGEPSQKDSNRTDDWTGWADDVKKDPSEDSVLSAWGISSEPSVVSEAEDEGDESEGDWPEEDGAPDRSNDARYRTQMGMPRVEKEDLSGGAVPDDVERGDDPTQKFDRDSLENLEEQVRALNEQQEAESSSEPVLDDETSSTQTNSSPGAGVIRPASRSSSSEESEEEDFGSGETLHGNIARAQGPGAYSTTSGQFDKAEEDREEASGRTDSAAGNESSGAVLGRETYMESNVSEVSEADDDSEEQWQRRSSDPEPSGSTGPSNPGASGFGGSGPTGFKVDEPDEDLSIDNEVDESPFRGVEDESDADSESMNLAESLDAASLDDDESTGSAPPENEETAVMQVGEQVDALRNSEPEWLEESDESEASDDDSRTTDDGIDSDVAESDESEEFDFFGGDDSGGFELPKPDEIAVSVAENDDSFDDGTIVEPVDEVLEDAAESDDSDDEGWVAGEEERKQVEAAFTQDEPLEDANDTTSSEEPSESAPEPADESAPPEVDEPAEPSEEEHSTSDVEDAGGRESAPRAAPTSAEGGADNQAQKFGDLSQTAFGLIAGIALVAFLAVQVLTLGVASHAVFLALTVGGALGALVSLALPFLPVSGGVRSSGYVGIGLLVALLSMAATIVAEGLAVAPLVALFGSVFALGAGLVPRVLAMLGD